MSCCGFPTPEAATLGAREKLLYVPCIVPDASRPDYLATIDVDPASPTHCQVIHRLHFPNKGDELHHSGWNACSSCFGDRGASRTMLVLPGLKSGRIYGVDTASDPKAPRLVKTLEPEQMVALNLGNPHTSHCLPSGEIMVSCMGDKDGHRRGAFLMLDQSLQPKGVWSSEDAPFGYDFWYQPKFNVMVSTSWGEPKAFTKGFDPSEVPNHYGHSLYIWDWKQRKMMQEINVGAQGAIPLEVRFLHNPHKPHGYVGAALGSSIIHFAQDEVTGKWVHRVEIQQEATRVQGWMLPEVPPLITDIIISMDDKFLYWSNWLRGDIVQCNISDPSHPKVTSRVWLGGVARKGGPVKVEGGLPDGLTEMPELPKVKGHTLLGGPQMLQLSLDGKRLFVTNSLFTAWDKQFYPEMVEKGSCLLQIDVDTERGQMELNPDFYVDFGAEPGGPVLAHEMRYPGGDCTSDIFLAKEP